MINAAVTRRSYLLPCLVMVTGLLLAVSATRYVKKVLERDMKRNFDDSCLGIQNKITERLCDHARILRSGAAFFNADEYVTRDEWHAFIGRGKSEQDLPGIQGIGISLLIPRKKLDRHIQAIRNEGFPDYTVNPAGNREVYTPVMYIEPFNERNRRAFGYDTFSEPVRRAAMERARDEDLAVLSGKVTLVQDEGQDDAQAGTLMYVPMYRKSMPIDSVEQRRAAIYGWVSGVYRMTDMLNGVLVDGALNHKKGFHLRVFDGAYAVSPNLLYQCHSPESVFREMNEQFSALIPIEFNGHRWTLQFIQTGHGLFSAQYTEVWLTLLGGILIDVLLSVLIWTLANTRVKAQRISEKLTVDLQDERQRMASIIQGTNVGTWEWNIQTDGLVCNEMWAQMIGYTLSELAPLSIKTWESLTHPADLKNSDKMLNRHFSGELPFYECECRMKHKDGRWIWILDRGQLTTRTVDGQPLMMYGTHMDITGRKQTEEKITALLTESKKAQAALLGILEDEARTKAELRKSEERMTLVLESANDGWWDWDLISNELYYSIRWWNMLGLEQNELPADAALWQRLLHPDDAERVNRFFENALENGTARYEIEFRLQHKSGSYVNVISKGSIFLNESGKPVRVCGVNVDITERKQAEELLQQRKSYLSAIIENQPGLVWLKDTAGRFLAVNQAFTKACGQTHSKDLFGKTDMDIWPAELAGKYRADDKVVMEKKESITVEELIVDRGEQRWFETFKTPVLSAQEEVVGTTGYARDITDRRRFEQKIRESEAKLKSILDNAPFQIWTFDGERYGYVNKAYYDYTGLKETEVLTPETWTDFVHPEDLEKAGQVWMNAWEKKAAHDNFFRLRNKHGEYRDFWTHAAPVFDETGVFKHFQGFNIDITDQKKAEEMLVASHERQRQLALHLETVREEERKRISRELHDDIGQILTALKIDLVVVEGECSCHDGIHAKMKDMQKLLSEGVQSVHSLCRRLRPGALDDLSLADALDGLLGDWNQRNSGVSCTFNADVDDSALSDAIKTTAFRFVQEALTNVSRYAGASQVKIHLVADEQLLHISFSDNGCGMEPGAADNSTSFGLMGMRERIEALGGTFLIDSAPGKGTRLEGSIPLSGGGGS